MPRLVNRHGVVVDVPDEKADRLLAQGYTPVEDEKQKKPAKAGKGK